MGVFSIFSKTAHWNFLIFCGKPSLCSPKILRLWFFWEIWKMALFGQNLPKFRYIWLIWLDAVIAGNRWKKEVFLKPIFKQVPFIFQQTTCTYSESRGPVENLCDPHTPPGGGGVKKDRIVFCGKKFSLILPKNIVWLLKINFGHFLVSCMAF